MLLALAAYAPGLAPSRQLSGRDLLTLFYPLHKQVADGHWARDASRGAGAAVLPDPLAQVAYPPALVRTVLPFDWGFKLFLFAHVVLAGVGSSLLARRLGAADVGVCLAAAGATLAGPVLAACRTPNLLAGAAWTGFAVCGFLDLARPDGCRRRGVLLTAGSVAMGLLAGGGGVVGLWGLLVAVAVPAWAGRSGALGGYARIGAATLLGALLAGPHLIPFLLWGPETARGAEAFGLEEAARWSCHPLRWVEFLVPGLSEKTAPALYASAAFEGPREGFAYGGALNASNHLGLPVLLLAAGALFRSWVTRGVALGLAVWLLLATPIPGLSGAARTPLLALLRNVPGLTGWRYPAKALLPLAILLPALAGVGLSAVPRRLRRPLCVISVALLVLAPQLDSNVIPTLPQQRFHQAPPVVKLLKTGPRAPRYLRLANPPTGANTVERVREGQLSVLRENVSGLFGVPSLLDYNPGRNRRLDPFLASIRRPPPELLDAETLARDACVGAVLTPRGVAPIPTPDRLQLDPGEVTVVRYEPTEIEAELYVPGNRPASLFLSEGFDPGWSATIEAGGTARPLKLREASVLFMAADVPAGRSRVVFRYRTPGLPWGFLALLVGTLGVGVWVRRESR